jgi:hypothetical protein
MKDIDPKALFKLSVLGPLVSRERLELRELQQLIRELAQREYAVPDSKRRHLGEKTIEAWLVAPTSACQSQNCGASRNQSGALRYTNLKRRCSPPAARSAR